MVPRSWKNTVFTLLALSAGVLAERAGAQTNTQQTYSSDSTRQQTAMPDTSTEQPGASVSTTERQPDAEIATKVKIALLTADTLITPPLHVDAFEGRVLIHGDVPSEEASRQVEQVARGVEGVTDVRNLLKVVPRETPVVEVDPMELKAQIDQKLHGEPRLESNALSAGSANDGMVLLDGKASTLGDHLLALEIVAKTPGVKKIISEIRSPETFGPHESWFSEDEARPKNNSLSDIWITSRIKFGLMTETRVPVEELGVDSDEGMVTLFGRVPDAEAADSAAAIASRVPGVKGVYTRVTVGPLEEQTKREEMTDEQIAEAIRQRLDDAGLMGADIDVAVESSEARLTGTIGSPEDLYDAVLITRATDGVLAVHEELEVQGKTNGNGNGKK